MALPEQFLEKAKYFLSVTHDLDHPFLICRGVHDICETANEMGIISVPCSLAKVSLTRNMIQIQVICTDLYVKLDVLSDIFNSSASSRSATDFSSLFYS